MPILDLTVTGIETACRIAATHSATSLHQTVKTDDDHHVIERQL
jgi:hypothetical protein